MLKLPEIVSVVLQLWAVEIKFVGDGGVLRWKLNIKKISNNTTKQIASIQIYIYAQ